IISVRFPRWQKSAFRTVFAAALIVAGCADSKPSPSGHAHGEAGTPDGGCVGQTCRLDPNIETRVGDLLAQMTLEEENAQKHGGPIPPLEGGPLTTIRGFYHTPTLPRLGIPGFRMADGDRGLSAGTGNATAFPVASLRGATWDPDLETRVGEAIGVECAAKGG